MVSGHTGPWWLILLLGALGGGAGLLLGRRLAPATYRREDERDAPGRAHLPWLVAGLALGWGTLAWRFGAAGSAGLLPAYLYLATLGAALTSIDIDVHRLPDVLVLRSMPVLLVLLALAAAVTGDGSALVRAVLAGVAAFAGYFVLMFVSPGGGGLGFGDVKLAGLLGMGLGWLGWDSVLVGSFAAFILAGLVSLVLVLAGRAGRKSHIAFGPFMVLGGWAALLLWPTRLLLA